MVSYYFSLYCSITIVNFFEKITIGILSYKNPFVQYLDEHTFISGKVNFGAGRYHRVHLLQSFHSSKEDIEADGGKSYT